MNNGNYVGEHRKIFESFISIVDDIDAQVQTLLQILSWRKVRNILSIGGGAGFLEANLLMCAPEASIRYLDPSIEQCQSFYEHMTRMELIDRVEDISRITFQKYQSDILFDCIISSFSWFYMGRELQWLQKLLALLVTDGTACLFLPNSQSIEADFNRATCPDLRMDLVGADLIYMAHVLPCSVEIHSHTKWISANDLFDGRELSESARNFAAFIAMKSRKNFTVEEWHQVKDLIYARLEPKGVPLIWDLLVIKHVKSE